jgi:hypothetical protein
MTAKCESVRDMKSEKAVSKAQMIYILTKDGLKRRNDKKMERKS